MLLRTLIHERVPDALRGRAFAAYNGARNGAELGALALGGLVVAAFGARPALLVAGVGPALIGLSACSCSPPLSRGESSMHVSKADLEPTVFGEYEGRTVDAAGIRIAFESMPAQLPARRVAVQGSPRRPLPVRPLGLPPRQARSGHVHRRRRRRDGPGRRGLPLRPGHFVQTLEPVQLIEFSPVGEHDRTMGTAARNLGAVAG